MRLNSLSIPIIGTIDKSILLKLTKLELFASRILYLFLNNGSLKGTILKLSFMINGANILIFFCFLR